MEVSLSAEEIRKEVRRLAPFHHNIGLPYSLNTHLPELSRRSIEYTRVSNLVKHAFPALENLYGGSLEGKRVLDVACNCGGFSFEAVKRDSAFVLGIDSVEHYIEQANFIKNALRLGDQVEFRHMDIESLDEFSVGTFDITFCFGILYHLEDPVQSMKRIASVTKECMLVDTALMRTRAYVRFFLRKPLWMMKFPPVSTADSVDVTTSLWRSEHQAVEFSPNERAVFDLLKFLGFARVQKIEPTKRGLERRYHTGGRASFLAIRS